MINPLETVPLNTKQVYVMATAINRTECEIYMPVDSFDDSDILKKKAELELYLSSQSFYEYQPGPRLA